MKKEERKGRPGLTSLWRIPRRRAEREKGKQQIKGTVYKPREYGSDKPQSRKIKKKYLIMSKIKT